MLFWKFWDWLTDRSKSSGRSRDVVRALAILNIVCLFALTSIFTVITMLFLTGTALSDARADLAQNLVSAALYGLCWVLVRRGSPAAATVLLALFGNLQVTLLVTYYGLGGGIQWYYGVLMAAPLVTIPGARNALRYGLSFLPVALFVWMHYRIKVEGMPPVARAETASPVFFFSNSLFALFTLGTTVAYFRTAVTKAEADLDAEQKRSESLLLNILPEAIAGRLKKGETLIADRFDSATVLFADLVHFTKLSAEIPAEEVVRILDDIFTQFDDAAHRLGLEKVKTIGDAYMAIGGAPRSTPDHASRTVELALEMLRILRSVSKSMGRSVELRVGIHTGPVVGGVIGKRKFAYDFWGDTVNTASRMESHGQAGQIHISESTHRELRGLHPTVPRGEMQIKGKGVMQTHFVVQESV